MKKLFLLTLACAAAFSQTFDVASIKPAADINRLAASGAGGLAALASVGLKVEGNRVTIGQSSLTTLVIMAYEIKPFQLTAPDWAYAQRYDLSAVMPEGATKEQVPAMLRALLNDRFHLKVHRETKDEAVYALLEAKGGHKMKPAPPQTPVAPVNPDAPKPALAKGEQELTVAGQQMRIQQAPGGGNAAAVSMNSAATGNIKMTVPTDAASGGKMHMEMERVTMPALTDQLTSMVDLPVVDRTGLQGAYSIALDLSIQDVLQQAMRQAGRAGIQLPAGAQGLGGGAAGTAADPGGSGSVFTSVQALGLKLEKQKGDIEHLVIDSADKAPTEN